MELKRGVIRASLSPSQFANRTILRHPQQKTSILQAIKPMPAGIQRASRKD
jgi:hypothetical protein